MKWNISILKIHPVKNEIYVLKILKRLTFYYPIESPFAILLTHLSKQRLYASPITYHTIDLCYIGRTVVNS